MRGAGYSSGPSAMQNRPPTMPKLLSQNINTAERGRGWKMYSRNDSGQTTSPLPLRTGPICTNSPTGPRSVVASAPRQPAAQRFSQVTGTVTHGHDLAHKTKDTNVSKKVQTPPKKSLSISAADAARPAVLFPGSRESVIYLALFGEVISCDLKTLGSDPAAIIELLKVTRSETGSYVIVAAHYRRSGLPHSAKLVIEAMLQESSERGMPDSDLKPVYLLLAGCETDLAKLAKAEKKGARVVSSHYASATTWLQKVFGILPSRASEEDKENKPALRMAVEVKQIAQKVTPPNPTPSSAATKELKILERELRCLRDKNAQQADQLSQLRSSKRKLADDYSHERNLRRKYQIRVETLQDERDAARKTERFALEQVKREGSNRKIEDKN